MTDQPCANPRYPNCKHAEAAHIPGGCEECVIAETCNQYMSAKLFSHRVDWRKRPRIDIDWPWPEDKYHHGRLSHWLFGVRWVRMGAFNIFIDIGPLLGIYLEWEDKDD